ncbi:MAG: hypothetical protein JXQ96_22610, partial [Cyclobacteriaceae bacterium]
WNSSLPLTTHKKPENEIDIQHENSIRNPQCESMFTGWYETTDNYGNRYQIAIKCVNNLLKLRLTAPAPQGEHGMLYFLTKWEKTNQLDSLYLNFGSFSRELYSEPISLKKTDSLGDSNGGENIQLNFEVRKKGDTLIVTCSSAEKYDCYFETVELTKTDNMH